MKIKNLLKACQLLNVDVANIKLNDFTNEDFDIIVDYLIDDSQYAKKDQLFILNTLSFEDIAYYDDLNINHLIKIKKYYKKRNCDITSFLRKVLSSKNDNLKQELVNLILKEEIFK